MQTVFARYEVKYMLTVEQYRELRNRLLPYMNEDHYGWHTICNLYYDTPQDELIRYSMTKPVYKEKLRLRSYGTPGQRDKVFLEIKKKYDRIVYKRRIQIPLNQTHQILWGQGVPERFEFQEQQILREIRYLASSYQALYPKVYLAYDRVALADKENGDFRVTFDRNIRSRYTNVCLTDPEGTVPLTEEDCYLMETKICGATPLWFARQLDELGIYPVSFSKYGQVYTKEREGKEICSQVSGIKPNLTEENYCYA